ncbi:MAG TPA: tetratricopeptide repeat protein, partial [Pyrinomonadaceae bacterium]|nr:tetratricopeptide repeat protein [Pyrinomonadaceae bacterium]
ATGMQTGISYFRQAVEIDPSYALAYVGLADAYMRLSVGGELPANEFFPQSKAAINKAIEIDDTLAEAFAVFGWILFWYDWNWREAENQFRRALELDPNSADAHEAYAHLLSNAGRHAEGLAEIRRARELNPTSLFVNALEGQFLLHAGQINEALESLHKTFELEPKFWLAHLFAASAYIEKTEYAEAALEADKAKQFSGGSSHAAALGAYALAKLDRQTEAQAALEELLKLSTARYIPPYHIALIYNGLDEPEETLAWLERGFKERDAKMVFLKVEPKWSNLHSEPRFVDLMKRMKLQ